MHGFTQIATGALLGTTVLFALATPASASPTPERAKPIFEPLRFDPLEALRQDGPNVADPSQVGAALAAGFNDLMSTVYDISNNSVEVRIGALVWMANIDIMESMSIQKDMKAARARGFHSITNATTEDFEDDFGLDLDPTVIVNPFVDWRIQNNVIRMSWWQYQTDGSKTVTKITAYGDQTYDPGTPIEGDMTLMDTKLGYEYRVMSNDYGEIFTGISLVYMRADSEFKWNDTVFGFRSDGTVIDETPTLTPNKPAGSDSPPADFGLAAISIRIEAKLTEGVWLSLDSQSLAIPFVSGVAYSYTDTKLAFMVELSRFCRLSVGYRYYDLRLNLEDFGSKKTDFYGRFKLSGGFGAIAVVFP